MSVLTRDEIIKQINKGFIKIDPLVMKNIGPGSIDLTLGDEFRLFDEKKGKIEVMEDTDYALMTKPKTGPIALKPGQFLLGVTKETIKLPGNVCGFLSGRSRFARLGIIVHATASFIQPGINNKQVLEIYNLSKRTLVLNPGLKICQLTLIETTGTAKYNGKYEKQKTV
jgi:dCTP deaminase